MTTMKELLDLPRFSDLKVLNAGADLSCSDEHRNIRDTRCGFLHTKGCFFADDCHELQK